MNNLIKSTLFITVFLTVSLMLPGKALGLSCADAILEPAERLETSKYVFVGKVTNGEIGSSVGTAEVKISKTYKGKLPKEVIVKLSSMWDSFSVKSGSEYLFLLDSYKPDTKTVSRGLCNYNATVDTSSDAFEPYKKILDTNKVPYSALVFVGATALIVVAVGYMLFHKTKKNKSSKHSSTKTPR